MKLIIAYVKPFTLADVRDAMEEAVRTQVPARFIDVNIKAFGLGHDRAREEAAAQ